MAILNHEKKRSNELKRTQGKANILEGKLKMKDEDLVVTVDKLTTITTEQTLATKKFIMAQAEMEKT